MLSQDEIDEVNEYFTDKYNLDGRYKPSSSESMHISWENNSVEIRYNDEKLVRYDFTSDVELMNFLRSIRNEKR